MIGKKARILSEEEEAFEELKLEWKSFQVPEPIHERIRGLFWEHKEEKESIKILMEDFDMKECYAFKCYYYSEAGQYRRQRFERIGIYLNCSYCNESCIPKFLR